MLIRQINALYMRVELFQDYKNVCKAPVRLRNKLKEFFRAHTSAICISYDCLSSGLDNSLSH